MNITIGIPTYDRPELLENMARSLYACADLESCHLRIYDDCSPCWDSDHLRRVFPTAVEIVRRKRNLGSDLNIGRMFADFLATGDDVLVAADSDMIFHPHWLRFAREHLAGTDGLLSLYNSAWHPGVRECLLNSQPFVEKDHVGSAGVVLRREIVAGIVANVPAGKAYDWRWSKYLREHKIRLLVSKRSYLQHLGLWGANNRRAVVDYGLNFVAGSEANEVLVAEFFQNLVARKNEIIADQQRQLQDYQKQFAFLFWLGRWAGKARRLPRRLRERCRDLSE